MSRRELIDEYFIENRNRLLEVAAFLDRLDRASDPDRGGADFRAEAFAQALDVLADRRAGERVKRIQMILSDPTHQPHPTLDQKSASGAWNPAREVR